VIRTSVRARLSVWHSGLLALLVTAFAVASYGFLRRTELARIDSTLREQSEIVTQAMAAAAAGGTITRTDSAGLLSVMHDLRARGLRAWVFDASGRPTFTTAMVHEDEGAAEERRVLGDTLPAAELRAAGALARTQVGERTIATDSARGRRGRRRLDLATRSRCALGARSRCGHRRGGRRRVVVGVRGLRPGA
jgi:hypothetical protein